jgi:hypothetical protein
MDDETLVIESTAIYVLPSVGGFPPFTFERGYNRVAAAHWAKLFEERPGVAKRVELGVLTPIVPEADPAAPEVGGDPVLGDLVDLTIPKAKAVIEATDDAELLELWREHEASRESPRSGLLDLLDARLEELTAPEG